MSKISEPWYAELAERYGEEFCRIAGYFDETRPWSLPYSAAFSIPQGKRILQFSGAFHPFHEGHLEALQGALDLFGDETDVLAVVHVDHSEYRNSKGSCRDSARLEGVRLLNRLSVPYLVVAEDTMPGGCSRNFTRLYSELSRDNQVYFVCGGDRANYALSFIDRGHCIVSGRSNSPMWLKYSYLGLQNPRIQFLHGDNPASSTAIRERLAEE